jgi:hypothetical protein
VSQRRAGMNPQTGALSRRPASVHSLTLPCLSSVQMCLTKRGRISTANEQACSTVGVSLRWVGVHPRALASSQRWTTLHAKMLASLTGERICIDTRWRCLDGQRQCIQERWGVSTVCGRESIRVEPVSPARKRASTDVGGSRRRADVHRQTFAFLAGARTCIDTRWRVLSVRGRASTSVGAAHRRDKIGCHALTPAVRAETLVSHAWELLRHSGAS